MRPRRRNSAPPISLFSFQDIITSVTGIMILVTLMLGLELVQRTENSPQQKTNELSAEMESTLETVAVEIGTVKEQLRERQQQVMDFAGIDPLALRQELADVEEINQRLAGELSTSERKRREAGHREEAAAAEKTRRDTDRRLVEELQERIKEAQAELRRLKDSNRVIYNPAAGTSKRPWVVEISDQGFLAAEIGKAERALQFADASSFRRWAARRDSRTEYFVLLIKPTGIDKFDAVSEALKKLNFDLGFDLLTASQTIDPEQGAAGQ